MPTAQDPQYASPATSGQLRRSRYLSDALKSMSDRGKEVYNTSLGTNASILEQAILGYARNNADERAEQGLKADKVKLADAVLGGISDAPTAAQVQAATQKQLGGNSAFDLTPAGIDKRNTTGGLQTQARGIFDATGDIGTALQFATGQQRQVIDDQRYEQERKDKLATPTVAPPGSRGFVDMDGDGFKDDEIFNVPDPTAASPANVLHSVQITKDGRFLKTYRNGREELSDNIASDRFTTYDDGGVPGMLSTRTGVAQPLSTAQQVGDNVSAIESAKTQGVAAAEAKTTLPQAIAQSKYAISIIDQLSKHTGFSKRYGWEGLPGTVGIMEPGSDAADAQALIDQVTSQAFLESMQSLRGLGAPSDRESTAAAAAATRLKENRQSPQAASKALTELRTHVDNLRLLAMVKAGAPIDTTRLTTEQLDLVEEMLGAAQ